MIDVAQTLLNQYWTIPYSWLLWLIQALKSTKVKVLCWEYNKATVKIITVGDILESINHPYMMFKLVSAAARANSYLWTVIWNSVYTKYSYSTFQIVNFNKMVWKLVAKQVIKDYVKNQINSYLINRNYTIINTNKVTVEKVVKKITKHFKKFFFK